MKRSIWTRLLAVLLVFCTVAIDVSAAGWGWGSNRGSGSGRNPQTGWGNPWNGWGNNQSSEEEEESEAELTLVEDASTVDNGALLRASTYVMTADEGTKNETQSNVKYFPVTMYNYDDRINEATSKKDTEGDEWNGLYFSGGNPGDKTVTYAAEFLEGQYYIQNIRAEQYRTDGASWLQAHTDNKIYSTTRDKATLWTLTNENGSYYLSCQIDGVTNYMVVGTNGNTDGYTTTKTPVEIVGFSGNANGVQIKQGNYYLNQWGSETAQDFGGYDANNDPGNGMLFYAVTDGAAHDDLTWEQVQNGTYYADEACTQQVTVEAITEGGSSWNAVELQPGNGAYQTFPECEDGNHYYKNGNAYETITEVIYYSGYWYIYTEENGSFAHTVYGYGTPFTVYVGGGAVTGYNLTANGKVLKTLDGTDTSAKVGITLYTSGGETIVGPGTSTTVTKRYAKWNFWNKGYDNSYGDLMYTGLAATELVDDQIVFNVPEGGIFNDDTSVKDIYEYVGLPFKLNDKGYYTFDSDEFAAYFEGEPQSGSIDEFGNITTHDLIGVDGDPQLMFQHVGDRSTNGWFPYNKLHTSTYDYYDEDEGKTYTYGSYGEAIDHHFGMRADIPFSMTANGRIKGTDEKSDAITFSFSGDDDVWVYIDGHLVIDLGGIHNRLDATIDFAANTITYSEENAQDGDNTTGSCHDPDFTTTQKLFTDSQGEGVIPMTRDAFALDPDHEMQVFYLERGQGTSNCQIKFNLPMNDTVLVTKDATKSWSQDAEDADLEQNPNAEDPGVDNLTEAEQAIVNNIDFGFTLYKKEAGAEKATPVANTNFYLIGRGVEGTVINSTDAKGHFTLKNGQSAKFITDIPADGVTYYVVEDKVPDGFVSPDFNFAGKAAYDYTYTDGKTSGTASAADASEIPEQIIPMPEGDVWAENKSYEVTVKGSVEANDSIEFICSNYLDAELPNPTALAYEDIIVIDYGLPVNIDPLANDVFRGDNIEIVYFGDESVTLTTSKDENGVEQGTWEGTKNFHSGEVKLNDVTYGGTTNRDTFTYTLNKQLTEVEVITYVIKVTGNEVQGATGATLSQNDFAIGKIYIVPATVMYYEENFSGLVTFKGSNWVGAVNTDGKSDYQEPGVVGTTTDSIYGSDVAYLNDGADSNGTSYYGDTTNGAIQFSYTFTGTETTVFARTSADTGYVQFKIYEGTDTSSTAKYSTYYCDTYYKDQNTTDLDEDGTLYNIPIFTWSGAITKDNPTGYGTYTVVATVAKKGTKTGNEGGAGNEFYLDGIRIKQPLNEESALAETAESAYAADGEANLDTITLRQKLIADNEQDYDPDLGETEKEWPFAVMTDTNGQIIYASDYVTIGPKEEVYLLPGQSVSFSIKYWHNEGYRMHLGMKAPFGDAKAQVGQNTFTLNNSVDCYYDITGMQARVAEETAEDGSTYFVATYTITATDKIVSLTNIKITGNYDFDLVESPDVNVDGSQGEEGEQ